MKTLPELDEKCVQIFIALFTYGELRFKDLKKILKSKYKLDLPEATILMHLNHLIKHKLVTKTIKTAKNVTYKPNMEKLQKLQEKLNMAVEIFKEWKETEEVFLNKPIEEQIGIVELTALMKELGFLKHQILFEKYGKIEDGIMSNLFISTYFKYHLFLIIKKCLEDEEYMDKVLKQIDRELEKIM